MALIDDFKARFTSFDPTQVDNVLPALVSTYQCYYGGEYGVGVDCDDEIILQLLAHLFSEEINPSSAANRLEASKSVGSVSVSYVQGGTSDNDLFFGTTKYGRRYLMLTSKRKSGGFFV